MVSEILVGLGMGMALWHGIACVLSGLAAAGVIPARMVQGMISVSAWAALAGLAAPITLLAKYGQLQDAVFYGTMATIWPGMQLVYDECLHRKPWAQWVVTVTLRSMAIWILAGFTATASLYGAALRLIAGATAQ